MRFDLDLSLEPIARELGRAFAVIHWEACVDGRDIEFVFGGPRSEASTSSVTCTTQIWVLDFNQCSEVTVTSAGVDKCIDACLCNDPYYPRPHKQPDLWLQFAGAYIDMTGVIEARKMGGRERGSMTTSTSTEEDTEINSCAQAVISGIEKHWLGEEAAAIAVD